MISACLERRGQIGKEVIPVVRNGRCLPVHQPRSAHDFSAICFSDALMSKANTEYWNSCAKRQDQVFADSGFAGCARTRRDTNVGRRQRFDFLQGNFVVSPNDNRAVKLAEILGKVVTKGVVVID
jgi:hypothetical protein